MKAILMLFIFLTASAADVIEINWTKDFTKEVVIRCAADDRECKSHLGRWYLVEERVCQNCFSNDTNMNFLFNSLGRYISTGREVSNIELWNLIYETNFMTINYRTPYNLIHAYSPIKMKLKLRALCQDGYTQEPILFFEKATDGSVDKPKYIFCGSKTYELNLFETQDDNKYATELY